MKFLTNFIQLLILKVLVLQNFAKTANAEAVTQENIRNSLLVKYTHNPSKWERGQQPDFIQIILNEQIVKALNQQNEQIRDVSSLYSLALEKMYERISAQDLVELLWKIYEKYDVESFVTMVQAQLALYQSYQKDKIQDPHYVLMFSYCLYKIKNDAFFSRLNENIQYRLNNTLQTLPSSLKYIFDRQQFCLINKQNLEVIYQTTDHRINGETSQVLTSNWHKVDTEYMGLLEPIFEESKEDHLSDLNLALVSKHLRGYLHRLSGSEGRIGANDPKRHLKNFLWSPEFVGDNHMVFRQEDFLICRQGEGVYALKEKTIYDAECQWTAGECKV